MDDFRGAGELFGEIREAFLPAGAFPCVAVVLEAYLLDGLIFKPFDGFRQRIMDQFADKQIDAAFDAFQRQVVFFAQVAGEEDLLAVGAFEKEGGGDL